MTNGDRITQPYSGKFEMRPEPRLITCDPEISALSFLLLHEVSRMPKKLTVRKNDGCTFEVHVEMGNPPQSRAGGLSLNLDRLKTELWQHGCSDEVIAYAVQQVTEHGSATVSV